MRFEAGGTGPAEAGQFPWLVRLSGAGGEAGDGLDCLAALISPRHLLTAASCLAGGRLARAGEHNCHGDPECEAAAQETKVVSAETAGDLAVLTVQPALTVTDWVSPVCFLPARPVSAITEAAVWRDGELTFSSQKCEVVADCKAGLAMPCQAGAPLVGSSPDNWGRQQWTVVGVATNCSALNTANFTSVRDNMKTVLDTLNTQL